MLSEQGPTYIGYHNGLRPKAVSQCIPNQMVLGMLQMN